MHLGAVRKVLVKVVFLIKSSTKFIDDETLKAWKAYHPHFTPATVKESRMTRLFRSTRIPVGRAFGLGLCL